jgi:hypothetical protein
MQSLTLTPSEKGVGVPGLKGHGAAALSPPACSPSASTPPAVDASFVADDNDRG